ncbi:caspase-1 [Culex quinquefasciatus]|uniref:caspase-1 n=1 Tax=Culex quinquefasciatus TaxID=7176 RepID=UPI0018E2CD57|nr:caspase-1 [Culex quinquefasciatus]
MDKGLTNEVDVLGLMEYIPNSSMPSANITPKSRPTVEENYNTNHKYRGLALIFCNMEFQKELKMPKRVATEKDRDDICDALKNLSFNVKVNNDLNKEEVQKTLKEWSQAKHHIDNDCLVVVIMTYGGNGFVYAKDGKYEVDTLWKNFVGNACPSLIGKPKIFFIQGWVLEGKKYNDVKDSSLKLKDCMASEHQKPPFFIPTWADLLIMDNGPNTWEDDLTGSCLIQSLCKELKEYDASCELLTLLTNVIRRTIYGYTLSGSNNKPVQMPCMISMLTKSLYFIKKDNILDDRNSLKE